jgi:hypothetical protein
MNSNTTLSIEIESGDAAFTDDPRGETVRALRRVADRIESGAMDGLIFDTNGNKAGAWDFTAADTDED